MSLFYHIFMCYFMYQQNRKKSEGIHETRQINDRFKTVQVDLLVYFEENGCNKIVYTLKFTRSAI